MMVLVSFSACGAASYRPAAAWLLLGSIGSMRVRQWGLGFVAATIAAALFCPCAAFAADANKVPPSIELQPGGQPEGEFGPKSSEFGEYYEGLAFFKTKEPDPSWAYTTDSTVSFSCLLDGQSVECPSKVEPCCRAIRAFPVLKRRCLRKQGPKGRPRRCKPVRTPHPGATEETPNDGPARGEVPVPPGLAPGAHTITVIASDEDGVDPAPPSVTVFLDTMPPSAPVLLETPDRVSRDGKPDFRFESADDRAFPGDGDHPGIFYEPFDASLRRIQPRGPALHSSNPFDSYISVWRQRCITTYECSAFARPVYEAGNGSLGFGIPELLSPGLYEFEVQARDAVGNESPATKYRFRILRLKSR
jgi:hypothetical protein